LFTTNPQEKEPKKQMGWDSDIKKRKSWSIGPKYLTKTRKERPLLESKMPK